MSGNVTCNVSGVDSVSGILDFQKDRGNSYVFFSSKKKIYKAVREKGCAGRQKSTEDDSGFPGWNGSSGSYINYRSPYRSRHYFSDEY